MVSSTLLLPLLSLPAQHSQPAPLHRLSERPTFLPESDPFGYNNTSNTKPWKVTRHVFPAAYPRSYARIPTEQKESDARCTDIAQTMREFDQKMSTAKPVDINDPSTFSQDEGLWIVVNRYAPEKPCSNGLTLLVTSQTGYPKETWEPFLKELILTENKHAPISDIWVFEDTRTGDSALMNEGLLGNFSDLSDDGRDIAQFILKYLPPAEKNGGKPYPTVLEEQFDERDFPSKFEQIEVDNIQVSYGGKAFNAMKRLPSNAWTPWRRGRPGIMGIGYSTGAAVLGNVLATIPDVFRAIHLIDPYILPSGTPMPSGTRLLMQNMMETPQEFYCFDEAVKFFTQNETWCMNWRPDVVERFTNFSLVEKCPGICERLMLKNNRIEDNIAPFMNTKPLEQAYENFKTRPENVQLSIVTPQLNSILPPWLNAHMRKTLSPKYLPKAAFDPEDYPSAESEKKEYIKELARSAVITSHNCIFEDPALLAAVCSTYMVQHAAIENWSYLPVRNMGNVVKHRFLQPVFRSKL